MNSILKTTAYLITCMLILSCSQNSNKSAAERTSPVQTTEAIPFPIQRGINISHWLSQNNRSNSESKGFFTERDVEFLSSIGYDHIRLPVDEEHLWDESGKKLPEGFEMMRNAITWCLVHHMRVVIDLHIIRSHFFNSAENTLFKESYEQEHFINMWQQISAELKDYPVTMVAYELLNEAVADNPDYWNKLLAKTIAVIRQNEPGRKIVIGSNRWQSPDTFHELVIPPGDKNIILSFHFYDPHIVTHYTARWENTGKYTGPVKYPGRAIESKDLKGLDPELAEELKPYERVYTRDTLLKMIREPIAYAKEHNLLLYCGEFGCLPAAPRASRLHWYADMRYILETNHIAWANWDYKGGFAIFDFVTGQPDKELINILLGPLKE
jgi:endoglucanase